MHKSVYATRELMMMSAAKKENKKCVLERARPADRAVFSVFITVNCSSRRRRKGQLWASSLCVWCPDLWRICLSIRRREKENLQPHRLSCPVPISSNLMRRRTQGKWWPIGLANGIRRDARVSVAWSAGHALTQAKHFPPSPLSIFYFYFLFFEKKWNKKKEKRIRAIHMETLSISYRRDPPNCSTVIHLTMPFHSCSPEMFLFLPGFITGLVPRS